MKIFIAGARTVKDLDSYALKKMRSIYDKGYSVLVGDCHGVDAAVQRFYADLGYDRVTVYASNGLARNNIGNWHIQSVSVPRGARGFDFYKQKDLAMSNEADFGFMIWDGESRGTLNNIIQMADQSKEVLVHLPAESHTVLIKQPQDVEALVARCSDKTKAVYYGLKKDASVQLAMM